MPYMDLPAPNRKTPLANLEPRQGSLRTPDPDGLDDEPEDVWNPPQASSEGQEEPKSTLHLAALEHAENGRKIFPCWPGKKTPNLEHGFKEASDNPAQIDAWWREYPEANIGFEPETAGLCVIEVDSYKPGFDPAALAALDLPATVAVVSPHGGTHYYFKGSLPGSADKLGPAIDTRGKGSYVLLPPSRIGGKEYHVKEGSPADIAELPSEITTRLAPREKPVSGPAIDQDLPSNVERARVRLHALVANGDIAREGFGGNDCTYRVACELIGDLGLSPETALTLMLKEWNEACEPPWNEDELAAICEHAASYGQNDSAYAVEPASQTFKDVKLEKRTEQNEKLEAGRKLMAGTISFGELLKREAKPIEELIPGLLEKGIATQLAGPGGSHKSRIALQWGLSLQAGAPVFGRQVQQASFVYLSYEDPWEEVERRAQAICRELDLPSETASQAHYRDFKSATEIPRPALATVTETEITLEPLYYGLCDYLRTIPGHKFVVLDSTYQVLRFVGQAKINENAVMQALTVLDDICGKTNSSILYLWHPSQAGQERGDASGWSVGFVNAPRARLGLSAVKTKEGAVLGVDLKVVKRNNGPTGSSLFLAWENGILSPVGSHVLQKKLAYEACIDAAIVAAGKNHPITTTGQLEQWIFDAIIERCKYSITAKEIREHLAKAAANMDRIRYLKALEDRALLRRLQKGFGYHPIADDPQLLEAATRALFPSAEPDGFPEPESDPDNLE